MKRAIQAGFTLIELVVVIVILGILAAVAIPQFVNVQQSAYTAVEDAACGAVISQATLLYASNRAIPSQATLTTAVTAMPKSKVTITAAANCAYTVQADGNTGSTTCQVPLNNLCTP